MKPKSRRLNARTFFFFNSILWNSVPLSKLENNTVNNKKKQNKTKNLND